MAKKENKMNAKEFAHELEKAASFIRQQQAEIEASKRPSNVVGVPQDKLAEMQSTIRQQQAEIEALKQIIDANNLNQNIGQFVKPVKYSDAWWREVDEFNKQLKAQEK
jgi:hypothetical protein